MTATAIKPTSKQTARPRAIREGVAGDRSPLQVDREKGIIHGVRVLGRFSPNCHGRAGVTEGTEYPVETMRKSIPLYEGVNVYADHPDQNARTSDRKIHATLGQLRNVRLEGDSLRADLHFLKSHPMAACVCEDVERGLGVYGLSHNAQPGKTHVAGGRLVIDELASVNSVDMVDHPATNKNLWESRSMSTTLKAILEARLTGYSKPRQAVAKALLEMDGPTDPAMSAPVEASPDAPAEGDSDDALLAGFKSAIMAILDDDTMDAAAKAKKIAEYLKAHEKLTSAAEPEEPTEEEDDEQEKPKDTVESLQKQIKDMKTADECRTLCESLKVPVTAVLLKSLAPLDAKERKALLESIGKTATPAGQKPKSGAPTGKPITESVAPAKDVASFVSSIRG